MNQSGRGGMTALTNHTGRKGDIQLSIIIVNYNTVRLLDSCLSSLFLNKPLCEFEVVVVDNHSMDESAYLLEQKFPEVHTILEDENQGFARAANHGYSFSRGLYCLVLNPDVIILPDSIQKLWEYMDSSPEVGVVFPKLVNPDGSLQYSCRTFHTIGTIFLRRTPLGKLFPNSRVLRDHLMMDWDHNTVREVDWALGGCMMVRREAIPGSQLFDERFFLYFEEVDLCYRMKKTPWKVVYNPGVAVIHHHLRESAGKGLNRQKFEVLNSWMKFKLKQLFHRH
jgi:GT2 family glycosyltransferase